MLYNLDGSGEREYVASVYTMVIYEQEFGSSLIKDVFGKVSLVSEGAEVVTAEFVRGRMESVLAPGKSLPKGVADLVDKAFPAVAVKEFDFTRDNWEADVRALWAMARTADAISGASTTPSYRQWVARIGAVNMSEVSKVVVEEAQRGLFRTGLAEG